MVAKVTTMFSVEVLEAVAVIETSVPEFSVIEECDEVNVIDGGVTTTAAEEPPPPHPARNKVNNNNNNLLTTFLLGLV